MKMTKLDINFDPSLPPYMQGPSEKPEPEPHFPYRRGCVSFFGLKFCRRPVNTHTRGPDPYSGEVWTCNADPFFFEYNTVVICVLMITLWNRELVHIREYSAKQMPWWARQITRALVYRYDWWMRYINGPADDAYGHLSDYE